MAWTRISVREARLDASQVVLADPKDRDKDVVVFLGAEQQPAGRPEQAEQLVAVAALHRVAGERALHRVLPPAYRPLWADLDVQVGRPATSRSYTVNHKPLPGAPAAFRDTGGLTLLLTCTGQGLSCAAASSSDPSHKVCCPETTGFRRPGSVRRAGQGPGGAGRAGGGGRGSPGGAGEGAQGGRGAQARGPFL